jgi:hypothetical protein
MRSMVRGADRPRRVQASPLRPLRGHLPRFAGEDNAFDLDVVNALAEVVQRIEAEASPPSPTLPPSREKGE